MSSERPNVLWVVTTQWRAQACGFAGNNDVSTPGLDLLAQRAVVFDQAVTPHPFGPFARAALLTGVESPENGVCDYFDALPTTARTVAHALNDRGYTTAFFGKWHLGKRDPMTSLVGEAQARQIVPPEGRGGFQFWEGFESGFQLHNPWLHGNRLPEPQQFPGYQSDLLCQRAGAYLASKGDEPWFCVVSLEPPHPPYAQAPASFLPLHERMLPPNVPLGGDIEKRARAELTGYYGHIAATDHAIGQLLSQMDLSSTAVVVTSVHGDMHGSQGLFRKGWPYEESVRVPLLVAAPGEPPRRSGVAVSLSDLPALTLSLAENGRLPLLKRNASTLSMPSVVPVPLQCDRSWRGLRSSSRKLVVQADGTPWLFFHLDRDPFEQHNLVAHPAHAAERDDWLQQLAQKPLSQPQLSI